MEDLQNEVLLLVAADTQQVGSVPLTEQVSLQPAPLLLQLGGMKHLHTGDTGVITVQTDECCHSYTYRKFHSERLAFMLI